jgi:hypothetical protein
MMDESDPSIMMDLNPVTSSSTGRSVFREACSRGFQ